MNARAWVEATREVVQNQNLILKPDSVLEYTCFDSALDQLADTTSKRPLFSMNDRWENLLVGTTAFFSTPLISSGGKLRVPLIHDLFAGDMGDVLDEVATAAARYERNGAGNFSSNLLGGRASLNYSIDRNISRQPYSCDFMARVWEQMKCMPFADVPSRDGFFAFNHYATSADKRFYPKGSCASTPAFSANYAQALLQSSTPWVEESVVDYMELLYPSNSSKPCGDENSIVSTNLNVAAVANGDEFYIERVCMVPGCYYVPPSPKKNFVDPNVSSAMGVCVPTPNP